MSSILSTLEAIKTRYSCRAFTDKMPSDFDLQTIAEAAVAAPSAMNMQPWRVIIVKDKSLLDELEKEGMKSLAELPDKGTYNRMQERGGKMYYNTPCQMIIAMEKSSKWTDIDCGIITQNIALAATSLGINSLICGLISFSFSKKKGDYFKQKLGFPDGYEIGISVLLGYAAESGVKPPHEPDLGKISVVG
ncbi:MAG: nitroreductase family protein [Oscillospiraceae bacterium]|nr:nitroreductase family protein [Oscillospiraceae bacterium]